MPNGFLFENGGIEDAVNNLLDGLKHNGTIDTEGKFIISQNKDGVDIEDRIAKLEQILTEIAAQKEL